VIHKPNTHRKPFKKQIKIAKKGLFKTIAGIKIKQLTWIHHYSILVTLFSFFTII